MATTPLRALVVCVCAVGLHAQGISIPGIVNISLPVISEVTQALEPDYEDGPLSSNTWARGLRLLKECGEMFPSNTDVSKTEFHFYDFTNNKNCTCYLNNMTECFSIYNYFKFRCLVGKCVGFNTPIDGTPAQDFITNCKYSNSNCIFFLIIHYAYTGSSLELLNLAYYAKAYKYTRPIGHHLAKYFHLLHELGVQDLIMLAHSLGCHIMQQCAEKYFELTKTTFYCTVHIDPAGPCFNDKKNISVHSDFAIWNCTYCWFCNRGAFGTYNLDYCDMNTIVNDGKNQPDSPQPTSDLDISGGMKSALFSHESCGNAAEFTYAIQNIWKATKCDTLVDYQNGACAGNYSFIDSIRTQCLVCRKGKFFVNTTMCNIKPKSEINSCITHDEI